MSPFCRRKVWQETGRKAMRVDIDDCGGERGSVELEIVVVAVSGRVGGGLWLMATDVTTTTSSQATYSMVHGGCGLFEMIFRAISPRRGTRGEGDDGGGESVTSAQCRGRPPGTQHNETTNEPTATTPHAFIIADNQRRHIPPLTHSISYHCPSTHPQNSTIHCCTVCLSS